MAGNLGFPGGAPTFSGVASFAPESANNPNTVSGWGAYPYGAGMDFGVGSPSFTPQAPDWGMGSIGFPAPPVTGPNYQYGTGMGFGIPDVYQPDPRIAQEADRNRLEAERQALEAARGGMNFGLTDLIDNRRQQEEDRRWAEENRRSIEEGGGGIAPQTQYTVDSGILQGGYDPGDMGDAATTQGHTDYMNAVRAQQQQDAEYQARVQAERDAIDASIRAAAAQSNAWNPQYNLQTNFNQNVAGLNPTNIYDKWASGQSTQYQPY